jgi:hypothetical protein
LALCAALIFSACGEKKPPLSPKIQALLDEYKAILDRYDEQLKDLSGEKKKEKQAELIIEVTGWGQKWEVAAASLTREERKKVGPILTGMNIRVANLVK